MRSHIEITRSAVRDLAQMPEETRRRIGPQIAPLADDPRPRTSRRMTGEWQGFRRLRIGEYRIIYLVNSEAQLIKVVRVGPRGSVYD